MTPKPNDYIPLKDPNSPKYNEPDYMHCINAMHQQFQACHPTATYDQLPVFTFSMYINLPLVEQNVWKAHATADKEHYLKELATYVPPPGYNSAGLAIPKWPQWSFTFFISEMQPKLQEKNPNLTLVEIQQIILAQWHNLPSKEKQRFHDLESYDQTRFREEMIQYHNPSAASFDTHLSPAQNNFMAVSEHLENKLDDYIQERPNYNISGITIATIQVEQLLLQTTI
jgi:hypothetical protein